MTHEEQVRKVLARKKAEHELREEEEEEEELYGWQAYDVRK